MTDRVASAVFDSRDDAEQAISELRAAGVGDKDISIIGRRDDGGTSATDAAGDDLNKSGALKGALGGAAAGTVLGIAALAIPGVGPLIAAGPILATLSGLAVGGTVGGSQAP